MWLVDVSIRRPVFATMLILSLVVLGIVSFGNLGVDLFPKIEFPYVSVTTQLPGASPDTVETEITDVVEEEVNTISGLRQMRSISSEGVSQVSLEFELEEDADIKAQDVRDSIAKVTGDLPEDAEVPVVAKVDPDAAPIMSIMLSGDMPVRELTTYADEVVKERLQRVQGVGSVSLVGGREREMRVWLDPSAMRARGVTADDVVQALANENAELPGGRLEIEGRTRQFGARTLAEAGTAEEFGNLAIAYRPNGQTTRIRDVARIEDSVEDETSYAQFNGRPGVVLEVRRQSGENTVEVSHALREEIEQLREGAPEGVDMVVARDTARFIESAIEDVLIDLAIAIVLAVLVTFVINPAFACCHAGASFVEETGGKVEGDGRPDHINCHDTVPAPAESPAKPIGALGSSGQMDCSGCADCDAYYQQANDVAVKAVAAELPGLEKILAFEAIIQVDVAIWRSARLRPPGLAPPATLSPVELSNILIL